MSVLAARWQAEGYLRTWQAGYIYLQMVITMLVVKFLFMLFLTLLRELRVTAISLLVSPEP